jgi:hypothetical protein
MTIGRNAVERIIGGKLSGEPPGDSPLRLGVWYLLGERSVPRMNTKSKQNSKSARPKTRPRQEPKKQGQNHNMLHDERKHHDQELPETRMFR